MQSLCLAFTCAMDPTAAAAAAQLKALETALNHMTITHYASCKCFDFSIEPFLDIPVSSVSSLCLYIYDFSKSLEIC
jgi:hypothetical protein